MAEAMMQEFPEGMGQELYDALNEKMDVEANMPQGLVFHSAGMGPNGRWRIVDVWESREDFDRFMREQLAPAMTEVTGQDMSQGEPPDTNWWPVHNFFKP